MKKILIISYYYNFLNQKSTAISINTRIFGIFNNYDVSIICFENPEKEANLTPKCDFKIINGKNSSLDSEENKDFFSENAIKEVLSGEYDAVVIHSNFKQTNILPQKIKNKNKNIKVILYMPDPYVEGALKFQVLQKEYLESVKAEQIGYEYSDKVIVTNSFFKKHMEDVYPQYKKKIYSIEHSYIPNSIEGKKSLDIVYLGKTYFERRIDYLIIAFDELLTENSEFKKFRMITSVQSKVQVNKALFALENKENFLFVEEIPFEKAKRIENSAYLLINITVPIIGKSDPYFPTKLAQYMNTNNTILTLADTEGFSTSLMKKTQNYYCKNNIESIKKELKHLLKNKKEINLDTYQEYDGKKSSEKMKKLIDDLIKR